MKLNYWYIGCILLVIGFILIESHSMFISLTGVLVIGCGLISFIKGLGKMEKEGL